MREARQLPWPFDGFEEELAFDTVSDRTVSVSVPEAGLPPDEPSRRLVVYLGLFDLLVEQLLAAPASRGDAAGRVRAVLEHVQAADGPLRFALHEQRGGTEDRELLIRMRGKEIAVTRDWMIPKLLDEIDRYRARAGALRAALSRSGEGATP